MKSFGWNSAHLRSAVDGQGRRVDLPDLADAAHAAHKTVPIGRDADADGRYRAYAGDDDSVHASRPPPIFRKARQALWPPKPRDEESATSNSACFCASSGT